MIAPTPWIVSRAVFQTPYLFLKRQPHRRLSIKRKPFFLNLYNNRVFQPVTNSSNGEVDDTTRFHYHQEGTVVWAEYAGGSVKKGSLMAKVRIDGSLDMRYHHVNAKGFLMTGKCTSVPEMLEDGRLRLRETWEWTSGDRSKGESVLEEVRG